MDTPTEGNAAITFDFIRDEDFRLALEHDYEELETALEAAAPKAALVLSGSIVEAVLVDYLQSTGQKKPDPLRMDLADLIVACTTAGVLTQRTAELSSVIRSYRNLIHPGRIARLSETFGMDDARVAGHVVRIIVREVAKRRVEEFGLTAEQLVAKFETDANAPAIVELLVRDVREQDLRRLLLDVLPARFFHHYDEEWDIDTSDLLTRLGILFRAAYDVAPQETQKIAAKRYVEVLREGAGTSVEIYDDYFFSASDLPHVTKADRELVAAHILARLSARGLPSPALLEAIIGLSEYLTDMQFGQYIDAFIRVIAYGPDETLRGRAYSALQGEYYSIESPERDTQLANRLHVWVEFLRGKELSEAAERLDALHTQVTVDDIPF